MIPARQPPTRDSGALGWLRVNLFSSVANSVLTVAVGALLLWSLFSLLSWVFFGASWERVWINLRLFSVYRYPVDLLWRPMAVLGLIMSLFGVTAGAASRGEGRILVSAFRWIAGLVFGLTLIALISWESVRFLWLGVSVVSVLSYLWGRAQPQLIRYMAWAWATGFIVGFGLLYGVPFVRSGPLHVVPAREWGGFLLTLILFTGIIPSFPLGILLALGRRSKLPAIKYFCIGFIEIVRGAPLIMWLFIASLLLPLLLNTDPTALPALLRAYVAITLFSAAYMAENVRGGLQAVPKGQSEAARALGLSGWQTTRMIVLPQALRAVIPAIVGQAIGLFKDTSLVFIVGLLDFFNVANTVANQPQSLQVAGGIRLELSLFLALVYWFFAYRMSVASRQLEKQLGVGVR